LSAGGDADDPAVWIHPTNRSKSLLFVSDKRTGVYVYNFNGQLLQNVPIGSGINKLNNIDVRKGLTCGDHQIDILAGNMRDAGKLAVLRINPNYGGGTNPLTVLASEASSGNAITLDSYLFTLYKRISDGTMYAFDKNSASGSITQWRISCSQLEQISVSSVRTISDVSMSISEGAVADDVLGYVYFVQENSGIHKYNADPSSSNLNRLSFFGSDGGTATDREGLALYACNDNSGYLLLSSQGNSQFKVYDRRTNALAKSFTTKEASGTDGIEVSPFAVTGFPDGFLAIHDGGAYYNLYDWNDISQGQLITCIDGIVSQTCNPADTNCDSCIDLGEISEYVGLWLNGKVKLADVSGAVGTWMGGC
jgi:3-phytase